MNSRFDYTILDAINNAFRAVKASPLVLGSTASGVGGPPGGIVGWLPQARVAYDNLEIASSGTALSGMSLVDNLNHIRYRLDGVEASGGATFLGLSDTPASYFGEVGKAVVVNATEDGLEFAVISGGTGATSFLDLTDVTGDYSLNAGFTVKVNNTEDALIFDQDTFLKLADAPHDYATYSGKYVKVNSTEDALEFGEGIVNDLTLYEDGIQVLTEVTGLDFVGLLDVTTSGNTGIVTFSGYSHTHAPSDVVVTTYPEMIINGGFDDDSVWEPDIGWSIAGGVAVGTAVDGYTISQEIPSIEVGSTYRVSFDIIANTGSVRVNFDGNLGSTISTTQHYEEDIVAGGTWLNINGGISDLFTGTIDNVSVKKPTITLTSYLTKLDGIEAGAEVNNISDGDATDLTDSGETTLHSHPIAASWEDLRIEPSVRQAAGTGVPSFEKWYDNAAGTSRGVFLYSFTKENTGNQKEVFFTMQTPHAWDGDDISMHVHWTPAATEDSTEVIWGLEYCWKDIGEIFGDTDIIYSSGVLTPDDANITAGRHYISEFADLTPGTTADGLSSILIGRIFRYSGDASDTYTNKVGLLYIDAHYKLNSLGSTDEYTK